MLNHLTGRPDARLTARLQALTLVLAPQLSAYARQLLATAPHEPEPLIRAELFGVQRFEQHARSLATAQPVRHVSRRVASRHGSSFFPRVEENIRALRQAYDYVALGSSSGHYVTPAAEWLLDNFHLVEAQLQQIHEGVPRRYYAHLPRLAEKPLAGLPRVYGIAWAYVAHTDSVLDPALFTAFLDAYQDVDELGLGELWALPTTLRVVLLENLRRVADRIAQGKVAREIAHAVWDNAAQGSNGLNAGELDDLLLLMRGQGLERGYLTQLWQRMPEHTSEPQSSLAAWTGAHCPNGLALIAESQTAQVETNLTISNIISSLRLIGQVEWVELIEPVSRSLRVLRQLPGFQLDSEITRQQTTQAMEKIAFDLELPERSVADAVVRAARACQIQTQDQTQETDTAPRQLDTDTSLRLAAGATAAYHLIGPGRAALQAGLSGKPLPASDLGSSPVRAWRLKIYLLVWLLGTLAVLFFALHGQHDLPWGSWLALALMALPASEAVAALLNRVIAESTRVKSLPRLDFSGGIPPEHRVLVLMPCMLTSTASNHELVRRLRLHWLASLEENAQFALLADWADAPQASMPGDEALLKNAMTLLAELNWQYPVAPGKAPRFILVHRQRSWCSTEKSWLGQERKRGKLEALVRLAATGKPDNARHAGSLIFAPGMWLADATRYILTLDSDTGLPPGSLRELVAIAAHPLNTPHIDTQNRRVTGGYGILQPRVVTPLPERSERTLFHRLFAGQCGLDPYSSGSSDLYQDLFGLGTFTGKGLLNVRAVHAVLDQRFPDDTILSHDLLEGSIARCGHVSDVVLIEDHPHHAGVDASRNHRWTRGDWQLLPLMFKASYYGIDSLGLWKMLDNLRRSLVVPASLALLVWVIFTGTLPLLTALTLVLAAFLTGPVLGALAGLVPTRRGIALGHFFDAGMRELWRAFAATAWQFSQLALRAGMLADAVGRTLWRLLVSRRHLLQWTTAAQAQAAARYGLFDFVRAHALATAVCLVAAVFAVQGAHPFSGAALLVFWALGPLAAWLTSRRPRPGSSTRPDKTERSYLLTLAHDTWLFFEHTVSAADNHLPPDNLQFDLQATLAHRTSPTNIGLYLLSACCAREFGWISTSMLIRRLRATLATLERLPKHQGHLFNWYHTETLEVLQPAYVSTVDSGNLAGHLLATAGACNSLALMADSTPEEKRALFMMAEQSERLCLAMNFRGLYNARRHLFHIGLRVHEQTLDLSYYDLLASESRLASFLAIAKGDVPRRHWMALGRPFLSVGVTPGLKSWSGSMFEYLMPGLVMHEPEQGLLQRSGLAAVLEQQACGNSAGLPWGISESAYFAQDHSLAYQYSPFGVPRLALKRMATHEQVVAPYASIMASMFCPHEAIANLRRLEAAGARGKYGFMDALDYTPARQAGTQAAAATAEKPSSSQPHACSVVKNHMAHHQGMALVALCNVLCGDAPRRWFNATPLVQAYDSLLHERTPRQIINTADPRRPPEARGDELPQPFQSRNINPLGQRWQPTQLLSNGHYSVALRANGAGVSRWRQHHTSLNISRWRDDLLRDQHGSFIYLREPGQAQAHSVTAHPAPHPEWLYQARFLADRVQFETSSSLMQACTTVLVSPEDDTEIRSIVINNLSDEAVTWEVISCFEVVLAEARADEAHPAFSNLFVHTSWRPEWRALMMTRRPRLQGDLALSAAHFLAEADANIVELDCITDRRSFLGRNQLRSQPALAGQRWSGNSDAHNPDSSMDSSRGQPVNGLDPVACLRVTVRIAAGGVARLGFATTVAPHAAELAGRIDKYLQPMHVERATRMAATLAQVRLRDLGLSLEETAALQDLSTALMYTSRRSLPETTAPHAGSNAPIDQRLLWRFGISGDKPLLLVRIHSSEGLGLVQALLRAQPWWSFGGLAVDVVVLNSEAISYLSPLQREILALRDRLNQKVQMSFPPSDAAGFFLLREHEVLAAEKASMAALARAIFTADGRQLQAQVAELRNIWAAALPVQPEKPLVFESFMAAVHTPWSSRAIKKVANQTPSNTPQGQFDAASGEFRFAVQAACRPARPWVNVISNPGFGFQVSETGAGYSWATNSRMHQLTPWSNDPVQDPTHEFYLLQDMESRRFVALTPSANLDQTASVHQISHGQGYSRFEASDNGLNLQTTFFADSVDAIKLVHVHIHNSGSQPRRLRALALAEWQLGDSLGARRTLRTWNPPGLPVVLARQRETRAGFGGNTAFVALAGAHGLVQWTADRSEFFDSRGQLSAPDTLGQRSGSGLDPCGALATSLHLPAGETLSLTFMLGHAPDAASAETLARHWLDKGNDGVLQSLQGVKAMWGELLGQIEVKTPDPLFDALVNQWLLYQTQTSRLWSKAGFYQAGGAFGFRDQLQDSMAFAVVAPQKLRAQIMLNASRQFAEGDVQHWWHAPGGAGVRTHFSDDLLWLPFACVHYLEVTGDQTLLDEEVAFIEGAAIPEGAEDAYYAPETSEQTASVYEHCARTLDRSLKTGAHGLPLMGTGDWNDGMNRVGHEGRGESVWLAWFLCSVAEKFAPMAQARGDSERADRWLNARAGWISALHSHGWDGAWFRRAFFDNGAPLGSSQNEECRIDLIAQAWAVLSGASTDSFIQPAMQAMNEQLISTADNQDGLLRLLTPPLQDSANSPGYIQAYPQGVRENGGQYNHAGVWAMMAQAQTGDAEAAWQSFKALSPAHRSQHPTRGPIYELEPYVMAGDVYGATPYTGRGGWSWYTGSAAWLYRAALEDILGLRIRQGKLSLSPCVPAEWPSFEVVLRLQGKTVTVRWVREAVDEVSTEARPKAGSVIRPGQVVKLASLETGAVLLVQAVI